MSKCPYIVECGSPCDCNKENPDCRIRELFNDFYKVEKLYLNAKSDIETLEFEIMNLNCSLNTKDIEIEKLQAKNKELIEERKILDGADYAVEITPEQYFDYKKCKEESEKYKKHLINIKNILKLLPINNSILLCGRMSALSTTRAIYCVLSSIKEVLQKIEEI